MLTPDITQIDDKFDYACEFLHSFFDSGLPQEHRKDLKKWRYYVINDEEYKDKHDARHVYSNYEEVLQLIQTANILRENKERLVPLVAVTNCVILQEKSTLAYFPNNLSLKQLLNPYKVVRRFFEEYTVTEYNDILREWLLIALSNKSAFETITAKQIIDFYGNMKLLQSAAWLIHNRISKKQKINFASCGTN